MGNRTLLQRCSAVCFCALVLVAAGPLQAVEVYRWVDDDGVINFSQMAPIQSVNAVNRLTLIETLLVSADPHDNPYAIEQTAQRTREIRAGMDERREARRERQRARELAEQYAALYEQHYSQPVRYAIWPRRYGPDHYPDHYPAHYPDNYPGQYPRHYKGPDNRAYGHRPHSGTGAPGREPPGGTKILYPAIKNPASRPG